MPWTRFVGFFPQTSLGVGSRLAFQRGRRSIGSLSGEGGHEEETVNGGGLDRMNFDGRPRRRHGQGGAWRGEAWTMHGCAV